MLLNIAFLDDATRPTVPRLEGLTEQQRHAGQQQRGRVPEGRVEAAGQIEQVADDQGRERGAEHTARADQRDGRGATLREKRTQHPIESETELPNGTKISGLKALQEELIRSRSDDFRRAMARKVMAYALGRTLSPTDIATSDALVPTLRARDDRLSALIELIVASEPFQSK